MEGTVGVRSKMCLKCFTAQTLHSGFRIQLTLDIWELRNVWCCLLGRKALSCWTGQRSNTPDLNPLLFYEQPGGSMEAEQKVPVFACVCKHAQESLCLCVHACVSIPLFPVCRLSTSGQQTSQKCYLVSALTGGSALMSRRPRLSDRAGVCVSGWGV